MNTNCNFNSTAATPLARPARHFLAARLLAISAVALCLSASLSGASVEMTFDGVNGAQAFGYYVGPYTGTMDGTPIDLFCVDFANEVQFGEQWSANLTPISSGADLSQTRWGAEPDALTRYEEAAWLSMQFASQPATQYGDIQATMWQLFYGAAPAPSSSDWLDEARASFASVDYGRFAIITNTAPVRETGQVQEFLTQLSPAAAFHAFDQTQSDVAPEPGTQAMIGLALVGVGWIGRRRWANR